MNHTDSLKDLDAKAIRSYVSEKKNDSEFLEYVVSNKSEIIPLLLRAKALNQPMLTS
jgi:hypothetical protein